MYCIGVCGETLGCQLKCDKVNGRLWQETIAVVSSVSSVLPTQAKFATSMELGIVWPPTWLELARVGSSWLEFDQAQLFAQLEPGFPPFGHLSQLKLTLAKLFCYCYVTTRSYSDNCMMVSCKLARLGGIVWPPPDASFDFVTWLELGAPFGQGSTLKSIYLSRGVPSLWSTYCSCVMLWNRLHVSIPALSGSCFVHRR